MFGISFTEIIIIAVVALVFVGPKKLPGMLRTVGEFLGKMRRLTTQVREQTGIDDILRQEGIEGGLTELRSIVRGDLSSVGRSSRRRTSDDPDPVDDPYEDVEQDSSREYPLEGPDAYGALPDDLVFGDDDDDDGIASASAEVDEPAPEAEGPEPDDSKPEGHDLEKAINAD